MKKQFSPSNLFIGFLFMLFFISLGLFLVISFRPLYYFDIQYLNIPAYSGFSKEVILENYNALMDYCSPFFMGTLQFPSLNASKEGLQHFKEVKDIFNLFFCCGLFSLILLFFILLRRKRKNDVSYLLPSSIVVTVLPVIVGIACAVNWDNTFIIFHKIFFRNDYWMFDWNQDAVIRILPDTFFLQCAIFIAVFVLLGSLLLLFLHIIAMRKRR